MSKESVFADPIRKIQEQLYTALLSVREGFHQTIVEAIDVSQSGSDKSPAATSESEQDKEITQLRAENKKLNYRIVHLLRALDESDAKSDAKA